MLDEYELSNLLIHISYIKQLFNPVSIELRSYINIDDINFQEVVHINSYLDYNIERNYYLLILEKKWFIHTVMLVCLSIDL